jgi:hypothetical protein
LGFHAEQPHSRRPLDEAAIFDRPRPIEDCFETLRVDSIRKSEQNIPIYEIIGYHVGLRDSEAECRILPGPDARRPKDLGF